MEISKFKVEFNQDGDCVAGDDVQTLAVEIANGGDEVTDDFLVLNTERWATDCPEDLALLLQSVLDSKARLLADARAIEAKAREGEKRPVFIDDYTK